MPTARSRNGRSRRGAAFPAAIACGPWSEGEPFLILSHRPFPAPQPYAEQGPIFLHAKACPRHEAGAEVPPMLASPRYIVRGYGKNDRIVYGSGQIVPTAEIPFAAAAMLEDPRIAYIHVRSASNNCYQCRIDRA